MRITIITGFFLPIPPVAGGATEKIWHRLAQEFAAAGHQVTFVSRQWPGFANREHVDGVEHIRVRGVNHTRRLALNLWHDFWWGVRVLPVLPPADVTICNAVALPAWLSLVKPATGRVIAVVARMPKGQGRVYGRVDMLFSLSAAVTAALCREKPSLAPRIVPFPFPIDWTQHARAATGKLDPLPSATREPVTISYIGRINPEKGPRLLLAAAARLAGRSDLPLWRLVFTGPWTIPQGGGGEAYRDALVAEFGPALGARLEFTGPEFDREALARRYAAADIFCYPSLAEKGETFGVAVAEAMAAGAAPVVSGLACFNELVRDGETGLIFDHTAPDAETRLSTALVRLLADAALRRTLARRAQAHARQFDYAESARTVLDRLAHLVAHGPGNEPARL